jgi:hypothetical protein
MWSNQHTPMLIKIRLNDALNKHDFTCIYKYAFDNNLVNEYTEALVNIMAQSELNCFNYSGLKFIEEMILQGYYDPFLWLVKNYKNYTSCSVMNVINHILMAVKEREEIVKEYKKLLNEEFGDVGKYVISSYL